MNVVLASNNSGKLVELRSLLSPLGLELQPQRALGVDDADETAPTFIENALIKARHAATATGMAAIADDSGLVVAALNGAPGVRSARYAGIGASSEQNNAKLVAALRDISNRQAHFYCALVFLRHPDDPAPLLATATWEGQIVDEARGALGFGYDPHFLVDGLDQTAAELSPQQKNRISHRGRAAAILLASLREALPNLDPSGLN